jgi:hypothetical protein
MARVSSTALRMSYPLEMSSRTLLLAALLAVLADCGTSNRSTGADAGATDASTADVTDGGATGDAAPSEAGVQPPAPLGASCIPFQELSRTFAGFDLSEVTLDQNDSACLSGLCLVNHFQGRASCNYGQNSDGEGNADAAACAVPGTGATVVPNGPQGQLVEPQCLDRTPQLAVTCSCRCANPLGGTDDAGVYCTCTNGTTCIQVVPDLVAGDPLAGGYCVPMGSDYDASSACADTCDPTMFDCPSADDAGPLPGDGGHAVTYLITPLRLQNGLCLPQPLPTAAGGMAACQIFLLLAAEAADAGDAGEAADAGDTCAHPGLSAVDPGVASTVIAFEQAPAGSTVCSLAQLPAAPCATSSQAGWCYLTGANAPKECLEGINVSKGVGLPSGATAVLACP